MLSKIENTVALEILQSEFGSQLLSHDEQHGMLSIEIAPENVFDILSKLKNHSKLQMNFLTDLCGLHMPQQVGKELGVVYHLHSLFNNFRLRVKTFFPNDTPQVPSITSLWTAANWQERETYDFYGIQFTGHPNLKRIMNMDDMDYHPLRKEYALEDETREDKQDSFFGR